VKIVYEDESDVKVFLMDIWRALITKKSKGGFQKFDEYFTFTVIFIVAFAVMYLFTYLAVDKMLCTRKDGVFQNLTTKKKHEYVGRIVSIVHAVIVTVTSSIGCFFIW
jgi:ABC-type phosphate transport system permease subunit